VPLNRFWLYLTSTRHHLLRKLPPLSAVAAVLLTALVAVISNNDLDDPIQHPTLIHQPAGQRQIMARRMPYSPRRVPPPQLNDIQYSTLPQSPPPTSINHHHHRSSSSTNGEFNGGPNTYQPPNSQYRYSQIHPPPRPPSASGSSNYHQGSSSQDHTAARRESAVATGAVGGAFGPYTVRFSSPFKKFFPFLTIAYDSTNNSRRQTKPSQHPLP
jgi:hypothetical protein